MNDDTTFSWGREAGKGGGTEYPKTIYTIQLFTKKSSRIHVREGTALDMKVQALYP